jgi:hypothetical protein
MTCAFHEVSTLRFGRQLTTDTWLGWRECCQGREPAVIRRLAATELPSQLREADLVVRRGSEFLAMSSIDDLPAASFVAESTASQLPVDSSPPPRLFAPPRESNSLLDEILARREAESTVQKSGLVERINEFVRPRKKVMALGLGLCVAVFVAFALLLPHPQASGEQRVVSAPKVSSESVPAPQASESAESQSSLHHDLEVAMSAQSAGGSGRQLARVLGLAPGDDFLERSLQANGDVSLVLVCGIDASANPKCARVSMERVGDKYELREIVQPAT